MKYKYIVCTIFLIEKHKNYHILICQKNKNKEIKKKKEKIIILGFLFRDPIEIKKKEKKERNNYYVLESRKYIINIFVDYFYQIGIYDVHYILYIEQISRTISS